MTVYKITVIVTHPKTGRWESVLYFKTIEAANAYLENAYDYLKCPLGKWHEGYNREWCTGKDYETTYVVWREEILIQD